MNMLRWTLVFVAHLLPLAFCLQKSVDSSKGQEQGYSLELMATSVRQLTELAKKLDKRLELVQTMERKLALVEKLERRLDLAENMGKRLDLVEKMQNKLGMVEKIEKNFEIAEKLQKKLEKVEKMEKNFYLLEKLEKRLDLVEELENRLELMENRLNVLEKREIRLVEHEKIKLKTRLEEPEEKDTKASNQVVNKITAGQPESQRLEKRSDDTASWEPVVAQVTQRLTLAEANIQALKNADVIQEQTIGTVYVRWGQNVCPDHAETVYSGYVGGSWYRDSGAASNYLCLPPAPTFSSHTAPNSGHAKVFGAEYETCNEPECNTNPTCVVCRIPRGSSVVMPARNTCYPGWTLEYSGYLMANDYNSEANMEYICVDTSRRYIPNSQADNDGARLYYTVYECGSLACPPYIANKLVLCVVCSK